MRWFGRVAAIGYLLSGLLLPAGGLVAGCGTPGSAVVRELKLRGAIEHYAAAQAEQLAGKAPVKRARYEAVPLGVAAPVTSAGFPTISLDGREAASDYLALGMYPLVDQGSPETQPATTQAAGLPGGYWRKDIWHQMGYEAESLGRRDVWRGFQTSFWDLENALVLTATMGASVAIRETGVDHTIRGRVHGHRQLGDMDETLQILGHPGTHFAATGVLWLTSALTEDAKQHEVAKSLVQALAVNGATTLVLKGATNTRSPNGERFAWPSGHTSSAFTAAAVLNEYYGPWVGVPSLALAGLVGYQRIDSREHDFSDVVFGAMLGYVVGTSVARDNKAEFPEIFGMKLVPFADPETGASGLALMKRF
jgi:membrane-associated phospholipid phosphatase